MSNILPISRGFIAICDKNYFNLLWNQRLPIIPLLSYTLFRLVSHSGASRGDTVESKSNSHTLWHYASHNSLCSAYCPEASQTRFLDGQNITANFPQTLRGYYSTSTNKCGPSTANCT